MGKEIMNGIMYCAYSSKSKEQEHFFLQENWGKLTEEQRDFYRKTYQFGESYALCYNALQEKGILCFDCNLTSWNENDVKNLYCGNCNKYHEKLRK